MPLLFHGHFWSLLSTAFYFTLALPQPRTPTYLVCHASAWQDTVFPANIPLPPPACGLRYRSLLSPYSSLQVKEVPFFCYFFFLYFHFERNSLDLYTLVVFVSCRLYGPGQKQSNPAQLELSSLWINTMCWQAVQSNPP